VRRAAAILCLALLGAGAAAAAQRGRIVGLRSRGESDASVIEVQGDRPLSFTTLRLTDPPRVVLDFVDTELHGVPREQRVDDGTVLRVGAAAAGARVARVVIELAGDAEFDVRADGARLDVRVPRLAAAVAQQAAPAPASAAPASAAAAGPAAAAATEPAAAAATEASPPATAAAPVALAAVEPGSTRAATAEAPPAPSASAAGPGADERARAALPTVSLAGRGRAAPSALASADRPAATALVRERPAHEPPNQRGPAPHTSITGIGFRPGGGGAVLVHSEHPLDCTVGGEGRAVLLHLRGAEIRRPNDRRPLDTRFFGGPVERVVPLAVPGGVDLRIELREPVDYQLQQASGLLTLTFSGR
jgi:hypothetical protein